MNRNTRALIASVMVALMLVPLVAQAGWHTKEIGWHVSYVGGFSGTGIVQRDTSLTTLNGASVLDTSATFSLDDADTPPRGLAAQAEVNMVTGAAGYAYASDTTIVGFLLIQPDSAAAPNILSGTLVIGLDGRVGGYGATSANTGGWSRIDSTSTTLGSTTLDQSVAIPIRTIGKYASPMAFPMIRARTIAGSAIVGSARLFFRYWKNDASNEHRQ